MNENEKSEQRTNHMPPWWPSGVDEKLVRECNCDHCRQLVKALEGHRSGQAIDGEHKTLSSFADA